MKLNFLTIIICFLVAGSITYVKAETEPGKADTSSRKRHIYVGIGVSSGVSLFKATTSGFTSGEKLGLNAGVMFDLLVPITKKLALGTGLAYRKMNTYVYYYNELFDNDAFMDLGILQIPIICYYSVGKDLFTIGLGGSVMNIASDVRFGSLSGPLYIDSNPIYSKSWHYSAALVLTKTINKKGHWTFFLQNELQIDKGLEIDYLYVEKITQDVTVRQRFLIRYRFFSSQVGINYKF